MNSSAVRPPALVNNGGMTVLQADDGGTDLDFLRGRHGAFGPKDDH